MFARRSSRALFVAFAAYSALTLLVTWPLVLHLTSALPHDAEDPLLSATILWWNAHVLPLTQRWMDGFFFYPAGGALAFSDHRLGLSPIASPLLWLGLQPVTVYNITFLATYPLCAIAAHALAFSLTRRHDASIVCGLAFGFNPFRVEHLPHLELLAAFGMPAALLALHRYAETRRPRWIVAFAAALIVQGLCASYYLLFFLVFVALWVVWFVPWRDWRLAAAIGAACLASGIVLAPIAVAYLRVHHAFGLERNLAEIVSFSADATSIVTASSLIAAWGWTAPLNGPERHTFPGLTIMILVALGILAAFKRRPAHRSTLVLSRILLVVACAFGLIAVVTAVHGAWVFALGPVSISGGVVYKPLSTAVAALAGSLLLSTRVRDAFSRRSPFAFYVLAATILILCSMGPRPTFLGRQFLYGSPYSWLMRLPFFDYGVRAPARFVMSAALALAVAAAIAFDRLTARGSAKTRVVFVLAVAGILADAWVPGIPIASTPAGWDPSWARNAAAVIELPLGETADDVIAMYHTIQSHVPTVNGYSGYEPAHYDALRVALTNRDETALEALAANGPLLVAADKTEDGDWPGFARRVPGAAPLGEDGHWAFFSLPRNARAASACDAASLPIAAAADNHGAIPLGDITDNDKFTWWTLGRPQQAGDWLRLDLGRTASPCAVIMRHDGLVGVHPSVISIATSIDGAVWTPVFAGKTGGLAVRGALDSPAHPRITFPLTDSSARFIRLRVEQTLAHAWWIVTDVSVNGHP